MTDKDCNPKAFSLVHEGAAKWKLHEPTCFGHWVAQPLTGHNFLLGNADWNMLDEQAEQDAPLLITGAEGTGKQEFARLIYSHARNPRRDKPFEVVDCEAMQPAEIATDIFGYGNGGRDGRLVACNGGTVLVRHIDRLPPDCRRRLVHFMMYHEVLHLDADRKRDDIDVRLLATARLDGNGGVPDLGELGDLFANVAHLPALSKMNWAIPELLSEFLRPYNAVRDVYVNWLLDLMCHAWPGNIGQLRRYCNTSMTTTKMRHCSVLNGTALPIATSNGYPPGFVHPSKVASSLLALFERKLRETKPWPSKAGVPDILANSLRLLVQLSDGAKYDFEARDPERRYWLRRPYYFHPYAIPLELFQGGFRTSACYDMSAVYLDEIDSCRPLHGFLLGLAELAANPSKLSTDKRFRAACETDIGVIATLKPSTGFLSWVGTLRASIPKYEEFRKTISVPALPKRPNAGREAIAHRRSKPKNPQKRGQVESVWSDNFRVDPREFTWHLVVIRYEHEDHRITFNYGGRTSKRWYIKEMKGLGSGKSGRALNQAGILLDYILVQRLFSFRIKDVMSWLEIEQDSKLLHPVSRDAAVQTVYRLNWVLWDLVLGCQHPGDESRNAITPSKGTGEYEVRFSVAGLEKNNDDQGHRSSPNKKLGSLPRARHEANTEDRRSRPDVQDEETDRDQWSSRDPISGLIKGPGRDPNAGRFEPSPDDEQEDDAATSSDRPGTPDYEPDSGQES